MHLSSRGAKLAVVGVLALVLVIVGFGFDLLDTDGRPTSDPGADTAERAANVAREDMPSALREPGSDLFPEPLIELGDLISGGPPPDGIPPIDQPEFEDVDVVEWLEDNDPILSLTVDGETRGYPVGIMTWHEIVNDEVGGTPVAVTYCPLCNSGVAFVREVDGERLDFGTSGMLYADNLVMYDRQTQSLWPQLTGLASVGAMTGTQLEAIPMGVLGWEQFADAHPDALVLTRDTGHDRAYGSNPYVGYDLPDGGLLAPVPGGVDDRLPVKERVVGLGGGTDPVAVVREVVAEEGVVELEVDGAPVVLWHFSGQASALDLEDISASYDVGTVASHSPVVDGRELSWRRTATGFVDAETGSRWDVTGRAVSGPLRGRQLDEVRHLDTFWFAWAAFQPDTRLLD